MSNQINNEREFIIEAVTRAKIPTVHPDAANTIDIGRAVLAAYRNATATKHTAAQPLDLDSLTRYSCEEVFGDTGAYMAEDASGEYVKLADVIAQARAAQQAAATKCGPVRITVEHGCVTHIGYTSSTERFPDGVHELWPTDAAKAPAAPVAPAVPMCDTCDNAAMLLPGGEFGTCQDCLDFADESASPASTPEVSQQADDQKLTVRDGIWWPEGYCRDPDGNIVPPVGKHTDFKFGCDIGYAEGLVAHRDSVSAIEKRVRQSIIAEQAAAVAAPSDKIEEIRALLQEAYGFASMSPRGMGNINAALDLLDEIATAPHCWRSRGSAER